MRLRRHLVIFARSPRLGRVKSRLATGIGPLAALRFHRHATELLLRRLARDPRWQTVLAVTPDRDAARIPWRRRVASTGQGPGDLGERMARAFRNLPPGPTVIIGSDIPAITRDHIAAAFRVLGRHDAVLGPADDGGYWLVGLRHARLRLPAGLFAGVRWSSEHALADTLASLPRRFRVAFLDTLEDIDDAAAYTRWREAVSGLLQALHAPASAASARPDCRGGDDCRAGA